MNKKPDRTTGRTPWWLLQRSIQTFRYEGFFSFLRRTVAFLAYKSGIWYVDWYVRKLNQPIDPIAPELEVSVGKLTTSDTEAYLLFHSNITSEQYAERLRQGQTCFVVRNPVGIIASATWMAVNRVWIDFVDREVMLPDNEVYLYDSYTAPELRGKRLQHLLSEHILNGCKESGYRQVAVIIAPENRSNIRSRKRSGFVRTGRLFRIRIGSLRYDTFRGTR